METLTLFPLLAAAAAYFLWFSLLRRRITTGPDLYPLLGSLPHLFMNRHRIHDWIAQNLRKTGGAATYQTTTIAVPFLAYKQGFYTVTCHPKNIEHVLRTRFDNYPKGPTWQVAFHDLLGQGIFNSDGDTWLIQRKTAALEFTTRTLRQAMARWVNRTIKNRLWRILEKAAAAKTDVDLQDLLLRLTFDNICGLTFGKDPETLSVDLPENPFARAFDSATEATLQRLLYPGFLWRLKKLLKMGTEKRLKSSLEIVENYMTQALDARKVNPSDDLLSRFMNKRDVDGSVFSSHVLKRIALNFVLAGRDTSSVALSWFFWLVMNHPKMELWPESHKLYGHGNELFTLCSDHQGKLMASSCKAKTSSVAEIWLWQVGSWKAVGRLQSHDLTVIQMEFSHDDTLLLSVSRDLQFSVFSIQRKGADEFSSKLLAKQKAHKRVIWTCCWSPYNHEFATGSRDKTVKIWSVDTATSSVTCALTLPQFSSSVTALSWLGLDRVTQNGLLAVGMESGLIELWSLTRPGEALTASLVLKMDRFLCHTSTVQRLGWRNQEKSEDCDDVELASCGADHCVRVFKVKLS